MGESCQLGKHVCSSYSSRLNKRADASFDLVHSNIWGHSRVKSKQGFCYFVIFIDDYSRCTWLYLMKYRTEL